MDFNAGARQRSRSIAYSPKSSVATSVTSASPGSEDSADGVAQGDRGIQIRKNVRGIIVAPAQRSGASAQNRRVDVRLFLPNKPDHRLAQGTHHATDHEYFAEGTELAQASRWLCSSTRLGLGQRNLRRRHEGHQARRDHRTQGHHHLWQRARCKTISPLKYSLERDKNARLPLLGAAPGPRPNTTPPRRFDRPARALCPSIGVEVPARNEIMVQLTACWAIPTGWNRGTSRCPICRRFRSTMPHDSRRRPRPPAATDSVTTETLKKEAASFPDVRSMRRSIPEGQAARRRRQGRA